jgi:hypothetical protein
VSREVVIYTDESKEDGPYYASSYGGALVESTQLGGVIETLEAAKAAVGIGAEVKWQKVSAGYLDRYLALVNTLFDVVDSGRIKIRIMFRHRLVESKRLDAYRREHAYHLLYYQFVKHAFGLQFATDGVTPLRVRLYLDDLPDTREKNETFKGYLAGLEHSPAFRRAKVLIPRDQIAEVRSHDHVVMQFLDVVLGAMQFRLNDHHKRKPEGAARRGKKTVAKETVYREINRRIRGIYPHFNIGVTTGLRGTHANRWLDPYRHWCFQPADGELDPGRAKPR